MNNLMSRLFVLPTLAVIAALAVSGTATHAKTPGASSHWIGSPVKIDGKSNDWPTVEGVVLTDKKVMFSFNNDGEFLYVLFRTTDINWVRTIKMTGLTLYFDTKSGKKKDLYIRFKGGPSQLMAMPGGERGGRETMPDRSGAGSSLTCYIKDRIVEKEIPLDGAEGPAAAYDTSRGFYTYEFRIPFAKDSTRFYGIGSAAGEKISLCGVWGSRPGMKGGESGMGGPGRGMPGGGPPSGGGMGGPGGGHGPGGGGMRPEEPGEQEVWMKVTLAAPAVDESATTPPQ
jgi:hypothetical protein